jgi:tripeptidyl-peptidase I
MRQHILLIAASLLLGAVSAYRTALVESLYSAPDGWQRVGEADPDAVIRLRIALEQPNVSNGKFEETLYAISSPDHPQYGKHLSRLELRELVKPREESVDAVTSWLRAAGISGSDIEVDGEWVNFKSTVRRAERLLDADFGVYKFADTAASKIRTLRYVPIPHVARSNAETTVGTLYPRTSSLTSP